MGVKLTEDLTVACVYWEGVFKKSRGRYTKEWVYKLRNMVKRFLPIPHDFVCLTNSYVPGVMNLGLQLELPGWWAKVELFNKDNPFGDRVLYLDLDTLIVSDLSPMVNYRAKYVICASFRDPKLARTLPDKNGKVGLFNSSVMVWDKGELHELFDLYRHEVRSKFRGDQDWFAFVRPDIPTFPKGWVQKLRNVSGNPIPNPGDLKVVLCMPWKNNKAVEKFEWVKDVWA